MNQLDIFASAQPRCAIAAVRQTLANQERLRELQILINLWHDYTWDEVSAALKALLSTGEVVVADQFECSWKENIYALACMREAA
ncbi:MAG: hypothetical protein ABFC42_10220 [Sulfuricella sp.]